MKFNKDYLKSKAFKRDAICLSVLVLLLILLNLTKILG